MYKLSIENLIPGMKVGQNIYSSDGLLLLAAGALLSEKTIQQLKFLHITGIYIISDLPSFTITYPNEIISAKTRNDSIKHVRASFNKYTLTNSLDVACIQTIVERIIENMMSNRTILAQTSEIRRHDDYTFAHSVNVCVLSTMLALLSNYGQKKRRELAVGALLHDIGKMQIPLSILNKDGNLTAEEMEIMKEHTTIGFNLLRKSQNFSILSKHVAFQHHEKYDGTGYPRQLAGENIHEYARIVAIADVYDALTSDRPYKKACTPDIAYKIMTQGSPGHFDPDLLSLFFQHVAIYPVGSIVKLKQGSIGIVIEVNQNSIRRPIVRLIANKNLEKIPYTSIVDLNGIKEGGMRIERILSEDELLILLNKMEKTAGSERTPKW